MLQVSRSALHRLSNASSKQGISIGCELQHDLGATWFCSSRRCAVRSAMTKGRKTSADRHRMHLVKKNKAQQMRAARLAKAEAKAAYCHSCRYGF